MPVQLVLRNINHDLSVSHGHDQTISTKVRTREKTPKTDRGSNRLSALISHFKRRAKSAGPTTLDVNKFQGVNPPELLLVAAEPNSFKGNLVTSPVNITGSVFEKYKRFHEVCRNPSVVKCELNSKQNQDKNLLEMSSSVYVCPSICEKNSVSKPRPASFHPVLHHNFRDILNYNPHSYQNDVPRYSVGHTYLKSNGSGNYLDSSELDSVNNSILNDCTTNNNVNMQESMYDYPPTLAPYPCPTYIPSSSSLDSEARTTVKSRMRPSSVDSQRLRKFRGSIKQAFTGSTKLRPLSGTPILMDKNLFDPNPCQITQLSDNSKPLTTATNLLPCQPSWETFKSNSGASISSTFNCSQNSVDTFPKSIRNCFVSNAGVHLSLTNDCLDSKFSESKRSHIRRPPSVDLCLSSSMKRPGHMKTRNNTNDYNTRPATICEVTVCHNTPKPCPMTIQSSNCRCLDTPISRGSLKSNLKSTIDSVNTEKHIHQRGFASSIEPRLTSSDQNEKPIISKALENRLTHLVRKPKCSPINTNPEHHKLEPSPTPTTSTYATNSSGSSSNHYSQTDYTNKPYRVPNSQVNRPPSEIMQSAVDLSKIRSLSTLTSRSGLNGTANKSSDITNHLRYPLTRPEHSSCPTQKEIHLAELQLLNPSTTGIEKSSKLDRDHIQYSRFGLSRRLFKPVPYSSQYESTDKYTAPILRPPRPPLRTTSLARGHLARDPTGPTDRSLVQSRQPSLTEPQPVSSRSESASLPITYTDRIADAELNELIAGSDPVWWSHLLPYKPTNLPSSLADRLRQRSSLILTGSSPTAHLSNSSLPTSLPLNASSVSNFKPFVQPNLMSQSMYEQREPTPSQPRPDSGSSSSTPKGNDTRDARSRLPLRPLSVHTDNPRATTFLMPSLSHLSSTVVPNKIPNNSHSLCTRPSSLSITSTAQIPAHSSIKSEAQTCQLDIHCDPDLGSPSVLNGLLSESLVKASCPSDSPLLGQYCRLLMLQTPPSTPTEPSSEQSKSGVAPTAFV